MDNKDSFLEKIFSVKNTARHHKQICILNFKIKFKRKYRNKHLYENLPIQKNKIIFESVLKNYNCNPKYIIEEIIKRKLPYDLVWAYQNETEIENIPNYVRYVQKDSRNYFKECATAKIWISNERIKSLVYRGLYKREGQIYINTWHGSLGGKKCTTDRNTALDYYIVEPFEIESKQIDYLISNSEYENSFYKRIFWNNGKILQFGHARNDIFFNKEKTNILKEKIYKQYNIAKDKKIFLYAPTFRDNKDMTCYQLNYELVKNILSEKFGGEWIPCVRLHPQLINCKQKFIYQDDVINVTDYPDMQELLSVTNCLITDYSSCIFDYMLTGNPAFIYAKDLQEYNDLHGLYDDVYKTPFSVSISNAELKNNILNFNNIKYKKSIDQFLKFKGCIEDGHASERVVDLIEKIIGETNMKELDMAKTLASVERERERERERESYPSI